MSIYNTWKISVKLQLLTSGYFDHSYALGGWKLETASGWGNPNTGEYSRGEWRVWDEITPNWLSDGDFVEIPTNVYFRILLRFVEGKYHTRFGTAWLDELNPPHTSSIGGESWLFLGLYQDLDNLGSVQVLYANPPDHDVKWIIRGYEGQGLIRSEYAPSGSGYRSIYYTGSTLATFQSHDLGWRDAPTPSLDLWFSSGDISIVPRIIKLYIRTTELDGYRINNSGYSRWIQEPDTATMTQDFWIPASYDQVMVKTLLFIPESEEALAEIRQTIEQGQDLATLFYGIATGAGNVYLGIETPTNKVLVSTRGSWCKDLKIKIFDGLVYLVWIRAQAVTSEVNYAVVTRDGSSVYTNHFTKNVGEHPNNIDFTVSGGFLHLVWDSSIRASSSDIRTAKINLPQVYVDMNPAHIIRECLTNTIWGMGYPVTDIDDASFREAADTLYDEHFGLSFLWDRSNELERIITQILRHIDAVLYVDIRTGKFILKLIRKDYDLETLPVIGDDQIIEMQDFSIRSKHELVNTVVINYVDAQHDESRSITLHNIALMQSQASIISQEFEFKMISNPVLANKVAARELKYAGNEIASGSLICTRECAKYSIGEVFKLTFPDYNIESLIARIIQVSYGTLQDGQVVIDFVQDIGGLEDSVYAVSQRLKPRSESPDLSIYEPGVLLSKMQEIPYYTLNRTLGDRQAVWDRMDEMSGFINLAVRKPHKTARDFIYAMRTSEETAFRTGGVGQFTSTALIDQDIAKQEETMQLQLINWSQPEKVKINSYALINDELVSVESISLDSKIVIKRGILDTVPQVHARNSRIWFFESTINSDYFEYLSQEAVNALATVRLQDGSVVPVMTSASVLMNHRFIRPYPPAKFRINDVYLPSEISGELGTISWNHRNRLQQTAYFVEQHEDDITPETGTTYTVLIYDEEDVLIREETGIVGKSFEYTNEMEIEDTRMFSFYIGETVFTNFGARYE